MQTLFNISELTISYASQIPLSERPKIHCAQDAERVFRACWSEHIELLEDSYLLLLNKANQAIGMLHLSKGGVSGTVVDVKIILAAALKSLACGIIVAHNHPSGSLQPSQADCDLTKRLRQACSLVDIAFLDHLIITREGYYSFADHGY